MLTSIRVAGGSRTSQRSRSIATASWRARAAGPALSAASVSPPITPSGFIPLSACRRLHRRDQRRGVALRRRALLRQMASRGQGRGDRWKPRHRVWPGLIGLPLGIRVAARPRGLLDQLLMRLGQGTIFVGLRGEGREPAFKVAAFQSLGEPRADIHVRPRDGVGSPELGGIGIAARQCGGVAKRRFG